MTASSGRVLTLTPTPFVVEGGLGFAWEEDALTQTEIYAQDFLLRRKEAFPREAEVVLGYSWVADGITGEEELAIEVLWGILDDVRAEYPALIQPLQET